MQTIDTAVAIAGRSRNRKIARVKTFHIPHRNVKEKTEEIRTYLNRLEELGIDKVRITIFEGNDTPPSAALVGGAAPGVSEALAEVFDRPTVKVDA